MKRDFVARLILGSVAVLAIKVLFYGKSPSLARCSGRDCSTPKSRPDADIANRSFVTHLVIGNKMLL